MIGLVYLIAFAASLTFAISSFTPARVKAISGPVQWLLFFLLAPLLSLSAFVLSAAVFRGQDIYAFTFVFAVLLLSGTALVACSLLLNQMRRWPVIAHASRFGTAFLVPYIFVVLEPLRKWLQISTSY